MVAMYFGKWKEVPAPTKRGAYFKIVLEGVRWAPKREANTGACLALGFLQLSSDPMPTVHLQSTGPVTPQSSSWSPAFQKPNASSFG